MAVQYRAPRGTQDILPGQSYRWRFLEDLVTEVSALYGFRQIRFPTFEHTELFTRSVGDTTDVVQKEMYTFTVNGTERSITLRPEGTAGTMRAVLERGLLNEALPLKLNYITSCFRYEKPQAGRLREFHQFGVEMIGAASPAADAEVIGVADEIFRTLGVKGLELQINSIGCPECRAKYHAALKAYFERYRDQLCETCLTRLEKNPMRILDCKSPVCSEIAKDAPVMLDFLCGECSSHFESLQARLKGMGIGFTINPKIVRGLDYYTKTVFEFVSNDLGAQSTVCGGGRYDGLIEQLGGPKTPGLGFGMGLERLLLVLEAQGIEIPEERPCELYIANIGEAAGLKAGELTNALRREGFFVECDSMGRSLKAQMKYADKIGARMSMVLGDDELANSRAKVKNMATGEVRELGFEELSDALYDLGVEDVLAAIDQEQEEK